MRNTEWIPTSKLRGSQASRRRPFPFRSYRTSTIGIILHFSAIRRYSMFVSVDALLSVLHSGARHVPWDDWGPAGTRIFPLRPGGEPKPAGPFWITSYVPLVIHDYNSHRARYIKMKKDRQSTSSTTFEPSLGPPLIDLFGQRNQIETHLPYRTFTADGLLPRRFAWVVADREWVVVVLRPVRCSMLFHVREKPIMCVNSAYLPYTMWVRSRPWQMFCVRRCMQWSRAYRHMSSGLVSSQFTFCAPPGGHV
jgi:hypothetical protein